ncbi:S-layer family protein, partial [Leptolyngbya sp. FACHB-541]|uniref:beta strand repeat-containing protein n=1 Tax=Leptolyngbya sp. FACHB-541 TaxID=2692810 RepID=UPI001686CFA2
FADSFSLTNGASIIASTAGEGNAGSVTVNARDRVSLDVGDIFSNVRETAVGNGGAIRIFADSFSLTNGASIIASTAGEGNAGSVTVNARDRVSLDFGDIFSNVRETAVGNGGAIRITANTFSLSNGANLLSSTIGQGNAGNITIRADRSVFLRGGNQGLFTDISSAVNGIGRGRAGDIDVATDSLSIANGARLLTSTGGQGRAGDITINARNQISLDGSDSDRVRSLISSGSTEAGRGRGGDIQITADSLSVTRGAQISATADGRGRAGNIIINARDTVSFDGETPDGQQTSSAVSTVGTTGVGQGGRIQIRTGSLSLTDGGQLQTLSQGQGNAGNIIIDASENITFDGTTSNGRFPSGAFSNVETIGGVGNGGTIRIAADSFTLTNRGLVTTRNSNQGNAGNIDIRADNLILNGGTINAQTVARNGGNIALQDVDLLLMRNDSLISTEAGTAQQGGGGNGGDITIGDGFIVTVPLENSDIEANAFDGRGGNIQIATQGIFGTQFRETQTPASDITASSRFGVSGTVQINNPVVDPSQGLVELPSTIIDASNLIAQTCPAGGSTTNDLSEFVITGRGGLPPSPSDPQDEDAVLTDWATLEDSQELRRERQLANEIERIPEEIPENGNSEAILEAQGWQLNENGDVILIAQTSSISPDSVAISSRDCALGGTER